jgi:diguanylate cyclase (GGDEF)-like protein
MNTPQNTVFTRENFAKSNRNFLILAASSIIALIATFFISTSELEFSLRAIIFGSILFLYLAICTTIYFFREKSVENVPDAISETKSLPFKHDVESRLFALEEANQFFGASLKPADMFRLVASRVNELIPFAACVVFVADELQEKLTIEFADGKNSANLRKVQIDAIEGNAGKTFFSREPQFDQKLLLEKTAVNPIHLKEFNSAIAVPLFRGDEVFGVLQLYGDSENSFDPDSPLLLEAIGIRVAPLLLSSFAFEQSMANALTDSLTDLPNERAFFLVLENQIAEAQRFRERPLSILAIDLKDFNEVNQTYGHAGGDRLLKFTGEIIKAQLRQMDFIARSSNDEFLVILPTASEQIARDVIERIERTFVTKPFGISTDNKIFLQFNFGMAAFGEDGETAQQLLKSANVRKHQTKTNLPNKVLWFPKEFVN